jgi:hypothetical protein
MMTQILKYEETWRRNKNENTEQCLAVEHEMYLEFLYQTQKGEEIGVVDRDTFEEIIITSFIKISWHFLMHISTSMIPK